MTHLEPPQDRKLAARVIEANVAQTSRKIEMGRIGSWIGGASEKPGNIAFIAIAAALVFLAVILLFGDAEAKKLGMTIFGGIITTALGYLFGASSRRGGDSA